MNFTSKLRCEDNEISTAFRSFAPLERDQFFRWFQMIKLLDDTALFNPDYIVVRESPISGKGIFTTKPCKRDEVLMIIAGEVIDGNECERRENEENNVYIFWNSENSFIDTAMTEKIRYINHSCSPSASVQERDDVSLFLVAARDLDTGEEITIDYDYEDIYEICKAHNPLCAALPCAAKQPT